MERNRMIKVKYAIRLNGKITPVTCMDFDFERLEVEDDWRVFSFQDVELMRYIGLQDKNGRDIYTGMNVKYEKVLYTDCSREEVEEVLDPIYGKIYFAEGLWFGVEKEDGSGIILTVGAVDGDDFEVLD